MSRASFLYIVVTEGKHHGKIVTLQDGARHFYRDTHHSGPHSRTL